MKRIDRFDPVTTQPLEESERHYVEVHHPFARSIFRRDDSRVYQYVANRAVRQYDVNGGFDQRPDAWRFVIEEVDDDIQTANEWLPAWVQQSVWRDHTNCIRNIQAFDVNAEEVLDRRSGQMVFVKYLFEYDRPADVTADELDEHYSTNHLPALRERLRDAFGFRLFVTNRVLRQVAADDLEEEGQVLTDQYLRETYRYRYEEYWFDNSAWGEEFFRQDEVQSLLRSSAYASMSGYEVVVRCGVDKL